MSVLSVLLPVTIMYALEVLTTNIAGRRLLHLAEAVVDRVPFVKAIYRAPKHVVETLAGESGSSFERVALVPYPSDKLRSIGFVKNITTDPVSGAQACICFVARAPIPTTRFVLVAKRSPALELNWTLEKTTRATMSAGVLLPPGAPVECSRTSAR